MGRDVETRCTGIGGLPTAHTSSACRLRVSLVYGRDSASDTCSIKSLTEKQSSHMMEVPNTLVSNKV